MENIVKFSPRLDDTPGFITRMVRGITIEEHVLEELRQLKNDEGEYIFEHLEPWGQGCLSSRASQLISRAIDKDGRPLLIKFQPDILGILKSGKVILIEVKGGETYKKTGKHAVENESLDGLLKHAAFYNISAWIIFADGNGVKALKFAHSPAREMKIGSRKGSGNDFSTLPISETTPMVRPYVENEPNQGV